MTSPTAAKMTTGGDAFLDNIQINDQVERQSIYSDDEEGKQSNIKKMKTIRKSITIKKALNPQL